MLCAIIWFEETVHNQDEKIGAEMKMPEKSIRPVSRSDFFPKLIALQKLANARHSMIVKISNAGLPNRRKLACVLDSFNPEDRPNITLLLAAYGTAMMDHINRSALPLMFNGLGENQIAEAPNLAPFVARLKGECVSFSGVAFPVRLGSMGNGYTVLMASHIDLDSEVIIDLHQRSHQLMKDFLALDERKSIHDDVLTAREIACLQNVGNGMISEEIGEKLGLSVHTVNAYLSTATTKLNSVNRIQAIGKAIRLGYIV